jgi:hypothetical protein
MPISLAGKEAGINEPSVGSRCSLGFEQNRLCDTVYAPHQPSAPCRKPHRFAFLAPAVRTLSVVLDVDQTGNLLGFKHYVRRRADLSPAASLSSSLFYFPPFSSLLHVDHLSVPPLPAYTKPRLASSRARKLWPNSPPLFPSCVSESTLAHPQFCFRSRACEATLTHFPPIFRSVCVLVRQPRPALHFSFTVFHSPTRSQNQYHRRTRDLNSESRSIPQALAYSFHLSMFLRTHAWAFSLPYTINWSIDSD